MPPRTNATAKDGSGSVSASHAGKAKVKAYKTVKELKKAYIPSKKPKLSDYGSFADECSAVLLQMEDPTSRLRILEAEEADNAKDDIEKHKQVKGRQSSKKNTWKSDLYNACRDCIKEVKAIKVRGSAAAAIVKEADTTIAKFEDLKHTAAPKGKSLASVLNTLENCYKHVKTFDIDTDIKDLEDQPISHNQRVAENRYRNAYKSLMEWLEENAETKQGEIKREEGRIQELEKQHNDLNFMDKRKLVDESENDCDHLAPTIKRRKGEARTDTLLGPALVEEEDNDEDGDDGDYIDEDDVQVLKYKTAKKLKKETIPAKNSSLADYDALADKYFAFLRQLKDLEVEPEVPQAELRTDGTAEKAGLKLEFSAGKPDDAVKRARALKSKRHRWKVEAIGVCKTCIQELERMKAGDSAMKGFAEDVDRTIARFHRFVKAATPKPSRRKLKPKTLVDQLTSLDKYFTLFESYSEAAALEPDNRDLKAGRRRSERRYRKAHESFKQRLVIDTETTEEEKKRCNDWIRKHERQYNNIASKDASQANTGDGIVGPDSSGGEHINIDKDVELEKRKDLKGGSDISWDSEEFMRDFDGLPSQFKEELWALDEGYEQADAGGSGGQY